MILRLFAELLDTAPTLGAGLDWKSSLQELTAARNMGAPSYLVTSTGPDHDKIHRHGGWSARPRIWQGVSGAQGKEAELGPRPPPVWKAARRRMTTDA